MFGGQVSSVGEILHGKTSKLLHDSQGLFEGFPQELPVTRYHSLAGMQVALPDCLKVTAWSLKSTGTSDKDLVIMGVRHSNYVVEGVQFHPESILTAEGRTMFKNFLKLRGGTWTENDRWNLSTNRDGGNGNTSSEGIPGTEYYIANVESVSFGKESILDRIYDQRKKTITRQMQSPSRRPSDFQSSYRLGLSPPQVSFLERLKVSPYPLSLMAEIKRASPSKGIISISTCAPEQAREYALAGASVISVLTEPEWFKGSIDDLRTVRQALEGFANRPAILCKDFVFDEYQILEARLAGADSILLIVKMLDEPTLTKLYRYSVGLGMEPLVEVNNESEMNIAVDLGARVIGVNNRNLTSFEVDLGTTGRLTDKAPPGTFICALSGISSSKDIEVYKSNKVGAVLVGEALMRASAPQSFVQDLLGPSQEPVAPTGSSPLLVKICGTRSVEAAQVAMDAGADFIGMILVKGRSRCVDEQVAEEISRAVHKCRLSQTTKSSEDKTYHSRSAMDYFQYQSSFVGSASPSLVGVFQDQPLSYILAQQRRLNLDLVQLHGSEPLEWTSLIPVPVLRSFKLDDPGINSRAYHALPLLDAGAGGRGQKLDPVKVIDLLRKDPGLHVFLAGGLDSNNVRPIIKALSGVAQRVVGVDVSSGIEDGGVQSLDKIRAFVRAAKEIRG